MLRRINKLRSLSSVLLSFVVRALRCNVSAANLPTLYFDQEKFAVVGGKTKKEFNFGDKVRVRIYEVHLAKRQIDLEIVVD